MIHTNRLFIITTFVFILVGLSGCDNLSQTLQKSFVDNQHTHQIIKPVVQADNKNKTYLITASSIGPIKLGMTLDEARRAFPIATFERTSDGDGMALVSIGVDKEVLMSVYADEDNSEAPIDGSKKITFIEALSALCATKNGIHPGLKVLDTEKILGKTKEIQKSEIESREYISFANQPKALTFRLDYTGFFEGDKMTTTKFDPQGKIDSIIISSVL
jgi:hypothetical protein